MEWAPIVGLGTLEVQPSALSPLRIELGALATPSSPCGGSWRAGRVTAKRCETKSCKDLVDIDTGIYIDR